MGHSMRAMVLERAGEPLRLRAVARPDPAPNQVLVRVSACGVCRTDLHIVDGDLREARLPLIPGHEIVGRVAACGAEVSEFVRGQRVGVPWLGQTCGVCRACRAGQENLCDHARFTGYTLDGGYAEYAAADARYCLPLPEGPGDAAMAPLLCAGLIGYRAYRMAGERAEHLGLYGFGAAAHILTQIARHAGTKVYAFTRPGDSEAQEFARSLGAAWAGGSDSTAPNPLDAAIIFAPVGSLVPVALRAVRKGGTVVCGGIHMSDIPSFAYDLLWGERRIVSVANLTRTDGLELLRAVQDAGVRAEVETMPLEEANEALGRLRSGRVRGAVVLSMGRWAAAGGAEGEA